MLQRFHGLLTPGESVGLYGSQFLWEKFVTAEEEMCSNR